MTSAGALRLRELTWRNLGPSLSSAPCEFAICRKQLQEVEILRGSAATALVFLLPDQRVKQLFD